MSKADKMFVELGYKKVIDNKKSVKYEYRDIAMGEIIEQTIEIAKIGKMIYSYRNYENNRPMGICFQELQAINEKVKELGWND